MVTETIYDKDGNVIEIKKGDATGTSTVETRTYDKMGNVLTVTDGESNTTTYTYDDFARLVRTTNALGHYTGYATETNRKAAFTYDALGRRIVYVNDVLAETVQYYYDGVNEIAEFDASNTLLRRYTHGISYVDERLMMYDASTDRPYYYTLDRMYNVRRLVDRAGAIVERYMYDPYGRPYVTEMPCRVDMNNNCLYQSNDLARVLNAKDGTIWDPRADLDDDGDVDQDDLDGYVARVTYWSQSDPVVRQAFSDVGNPYMFQGRPHFALDTTASATEATLMLNDHRARFSDPVIGRWLTRDPLYYNHYTLLPAMPDRWTTSGWGAVGTMAARMAPGGGLYQHLWNPLDAYTYMSCAPSSVLDPSGLVIEDAGCNDYCNNGAEVAGVHDSWGAVSYCCTEDDPDLVGPPACKAFSCYSRKLDLTRCPDKCAQAHEEAGTKDFTCGYYPTRDGCVCKGKHWDNAKISENDCKRYTANLACLTGKCGGQPSNPTLIPYIRCVKTNVCRKDITITAVPSLFGYCRANTGFNGNIRP